MDLSAMLVMLASKYPLASLILTILGLLVVVGQVIVAMTPTKADDEAWEKIKALPILGSLIAALAQFAPVQKK